MIPSGPPPSLLVVDDDEGLLLLMSETLRSAGYHVTTANSSRSAAVQLEKARPDLLLLDLKLRDGDGVALLRRLGEARGALPFVVVTGQGDEKVAVEMMRQGALDYVMKDSGLLDLLPAVVKRALMAVDHERALAQAQEEHRVLEREILNAGERERHSIGADLHDNLGQQLTALELMCTALKEEARDHASLHRGLDRMGRMLREAVVQTRYLARGLVPVGEGAEALSLGLAELVARVNALGDITCVFECAEPVPLDDPLASGHLYRIVQEAVNNAVKHARARKVIVRLFRTATHLVVEIEDDGRGLPVQPQPAGGLGLGIMQHRARVIGAEWELDSNARKGVTIRCRLPLKP